MPIFDGLDQICDQWLCVDENWPGTTTPRYQHTATLQRLCKEGWRDHDGELLARQLYQQIRKNWSGSRCTGAQNWRFSKQLHLDEDEPRPEVSLERTISFVTDDNWVNQIPVASGVDRTAGNSIDLIHRHGTEFTFIELKVDANNPLSAAFQIVKYAMVYAFSCDHAVALGYDPARLELLRATKVNLVVLALRRYFSQDCLQWLQALEGALSLGVGNFSLSNRDVPSTFRFQTFPESFEWNAATCRQESVKKDLLWAVHHRCWLFP